MRFSEHAMWGREVILILKSSIAAINLLKNGSRDGRKKANRALSLLNTAGNLPGALQGY